MLLNLLEPKANINRKTSESSLTVEVFTFISIHLMGEPYFACHNEFEGINKHQLSGMYYNWKAECLEWVRSHAERTVFLP